MARSSGQNNGWLRSPVEQLLGITEAFAAEELIRAFDVNTVGAHRDNRATMPNMRAAQAGLVLWNGSGATRAVPPSLAVHRSQGGGPRCSSGIDRLGYRLYGIETTILMPGVFTQGTAHFAKAATPQDEARATESARPCWSSRRPCVDRFMEVGVLVHRTMLKGWISTPWTTRFTFPEGNGLSAVKPNLMEECSAMSCAHSTAGMARVAS